MSDGDSYGDGKACPSPSCLRGLPSVTGLHVRMKEGSIYPLTAVSSNSSTTSHLKLGVKSELAATEDTISPVVVFFLEKIRIKSDSLSQTQPGDCNTSFLKVTVPYPDWTSRTSEVC